MLTYTHQEHLHKLIASITERTRNLKDDIPHDYPIQILSWLDEHMPEEVPEKDEVWLIDSHSLTVAAFALGYEKE